MIIYITVTVQRNIKPTALYLKPWWDRGIYVLWLYGSSVIISCTDKGFNFHLYHFKIYCTSLHLFKPLISHSLSITQARKVMGKVMIITSIIDEYSLWTTCEWTLYGYRKISSRKKCWMKEYNYAGKSLLLTVQCKGRCPVPSSTMLYYILLRHWMKQHTCLKHRDSNYKDRETEVSMALSSLPVPLMHPLQTV